LEYDLSDIPVVFVEVGAEKSVADLRGVLDDKSVDAVAIATPDHWSASVLQ
jgi:predicted dehydrogenase